MLPLAIMKKLSFAVAMLLGGSVAYAGPDFTTTTPPPPADRPLAASDSTREIEPDTMLNFAVDSVQLDSASASQLGEVAQWWKEHPGHNLVIQAHADRSGTHDYNLDLSRRRGDSVRDALTAMGVPADRIVIAMYGDRDAHPGVDETDRRAVVFASRRPIDSLAASVLSDTKADQVEWTSKSGAQMQEQLGR
jgi:outer membrane protein OmpA-like peptidoglycan-associated protein